jgi:hypothetical protein
LERRFVVLGDGCIEEEDAFVEEIKQCQQNWWLKRNEKWGEIASI